MFQVAAHPQTFPHHHLRHDAPPQHRRPASSAPAPIQLPRTLARPAFADIARDALAGAAPDLAAAGVPDEFIRHGLRAKGPAMLAGISALAPSHIPQSLPRSRLPPVLSVPLRAAAHGVALPTHALAVSPAGKVKDDADAPTTLYPVHAVVLAAHCTALPRMPRPAGPAGPASAAHAALPVLPLALPSPPAFAIIHAWLYAARLDAVLSSLLPAALPSPFLARLADPAAPALRTLEAALAARPTLHALATHVCAAAAGNLGALMGHAGHVKELWQDVVALGICDAGLWAAIDVAWEVVLGAMNLAAAQ
ncbi:Clampless protein 1 [Mycena indigotica]|uniref:Clampless protein 1 n=1 Tax=Mycena indigotica TaxID=2126181 RepID=A0A8H6T7R3_9AGAR|nr:Clampless protein 1 [Mycena indigotica]KAF7311756.1 Clampless protein 1 [Mycena indigotica]